MDLKISWCSYSAGNLTLVYVQQVLPENEQENYIYGMLAFPLLELGRMIDAEKAAKEWFAINKSVWYLEWDVLTVWALTYTGDTT